MWPLQRQKQEYSAVAGDEEELEDLNAAKTLQHNPRRPQRPSWLIVAAIALLAVVTIGVFAIGSLRSSFLPADGDKASEPDSAVAEPTGCPQRREWRTLSASEQQDYVTAVLCLRSQPSILQPDSNRTCYDDFPWIHSHVGYYTHNSAPFLPWHRYFLHIYESTLKEKCGYKGSLVYWDWTLDSAALEKSPVFDPNTGFGGDGEVGGDIAVGRTGRCLVDGPFAGISVDYYDVEYQPHCLSRGFRDLDGNLGHMDGNDISPESIEEVLSMNKYEDFVASMESRVHDAIPFGIGGDFETFTAPYGKSEVLARVARQAANVLSISRSRLLPAPHSTRQTVVAVAATAAKSRSGVV